MSNDMHAKAEANIGRGADHDLRNGELLDTLDHAEAVRSIIDPILGAMMVECDGGAVRLSAATGISPYLTRLIVMDHFLKAWQAMLQGETAAAIRAFEAKRNVAMALDLKPSTLSSRLTRIDPIIDAMLEAARTGRDVQVDMEAAALTIHPDGSIRLDV